MLILKNGVQCYHAGDKAFQDLTREQAVPAAARGKTPAAFAGLAAGRNGQESKRFMDGIDQIMLRFLADVSGGRTEVYNEPSVQHELGIALRNGLPGWKVGFERNVGSLFPNPGSFTKREIDLCVFRQEPSDLALAMEVKFPRNGQYPEQMFKFRMDIAFLEELRRAGFRRAIFLALADDRLFYQGAADGIYAFFRGGRPLTGRIQKPTGMRDSEVAIQGTYTITWKPIAGSLNYVLLEVQ